MWSKKSIKRGLTDSKSWQPTVNRAACRSIIKSLPVPIRADLVALADGKQKYMHGIVCINQRATSFNMRRVVLLIVRQLGAYCKYILYTLERYSAYMPIITRQVSSVQVINTIHVTQWSSDQASHIVLNWSCLSTNQVILILYIAIRKMSHFWNWTCDNWHSRKHLTFLHG